MTTTYTFPGQSAALRFAMLAECGYTCRVYRVDLQVVVTADSSEFASINVLAERFGAAYVADNA